MHTSVKRGRAGAHAWQSLKNGNLFRRPSSSSAITLFQNPRGGWSVSVVEDLEDEEAEPRFVNFANVDEAKAWGDQEFQRLYQPRRLELPDDLFDDAGRIHPYYVDWLIDFSVEQIYETAKATLFRLAGGKEFWLPKSQYKVVGRSDGWQRIVVSTWWAARVKPAQPSEARFEH